MRLSNNLFLIAEVGGNHEGDFELAKKQCSLAIESSADCVKFQLYQADSIVNRHVDPERHSHFKGFELTKDQHIFLANMCIEAGVEYLCSVWSPEMFDWIDPYLSRYKIGSGDLTAYQIVRGFAERGKPIILSTGLSTLQEINSCIEFIKKTNSIYSNEGSLTLLQCTSMYPIRDCDAHLSVLKTFSKIEGVGIGYSDHTIGLEALVGAVYCGARTLEFHFTDQIEGRSFRDHKISLLKDDVKVLRKRCEKALELIGDDCKRPLPVEISNGHLISFRRGLYYRNDLCPDHVVRESDIVSLRPTSKIDASEYHKLIGRKLRRAVSAFEPVIWEDF